MPDSTDLMCFAWARVRRTIVGNKNPLKASDYIGAPRSTLGQRRDLHAGAKSSGRVEQHYPEVYKPGDERLVNEAYRLMDPTLKEIMDVHYVIEIPRDKRARADLMGIGKQTYWDRVGKAKAFIEGATAVIDCLGDVRTLSGSR